MTIKQNINELNVIMKNGTQANLDKIKNVIDLNVDRKIVNFRTARKIVVQQHIAIVHLLNRMLILITKEIMRI